MFKCANCEKTIGPRISPVFVVAEAKSAIYTNKNEEGEDITSHGTQIVREIKLCPQCAGGTIRKEAVVDHNHFKGISVGYHTHAKKCAGVIKGVDCMVCKRLVENFSTFPSPALNKVLEQPMVPELRGSFAAHALENATLRAIEADKVEGRPSKRAKRDFMAAAYFLKGYEARGGGL